MQLLADVLYQTVLNRYKYDYSLALIHFHFWGETQLLMQKRYETLRKIKKYMNRTKCTCNKKLNKESDKKREWTDTV